VTHTTAFMCITVLYVVSTLFLRFVEPKMTTK